MRERCDQELRNGKVCARPTGHPGAHNSADSIAKSRSRTRSWVTGNTEAAREYRNSWTKANPDKRKAHKMKSKYGLTVDQYQRLYDAQRGRCWICEKPATAARGSLHVDHNHRTGVVRGLLCRNCNLLLGYMHEDARLLTRAGHYLDSPPAIDVVGVHRVPGAPPLKIDLTKLSDMEKHNDDHEQ